jgi:hypothetical protein
MYGAFDNSGNHILKWPANEDTLDRYNYFTTKVGPLAQNSFLYCPNFRLSLSITLFEDRNIGV